MKVISRIETDGRTNEATNFKRFSGDPEFMLSLAKGLIVLEAIGSTMDCPTIAKLSAVTGLSRAVKRCLYTLSQLGYARLMARVIPPRPDLRYSSIPDNQRITRRTCKGGPAPFQFFGEVTASVTT
jgi:IclR helix-turn-helix domain